MNLKAGVLIYDPFSRIQTLTAIFTLGLVGLVIWELNQAQPIIINFRVLNDRNLALSCIIIFGM
ncbi:MAG: hypothetical protein ACAI35_06770 [Candidatus Methylacidiphilales bacterium]|nr:hypothetical protein [Candidatus Methylacidiphilales bacterium]